jgi:hypothetical protein
MPYAHAKLSPSLQVLYLGENMTFELEGLHPFTQYNLTVINQVRSSPYYSDPALVDIETLAEGMRGFPCQILPK